MGEKHAFLEERKCGSRKVLRFMRSLLYALTVLSLPSRGAWIEMYKVKFNFLARLVAPLAGSVD